MATFSATAEQFVGERRAIVVSPGVAPKVLANLFPGYQVIHPGEAMAGLRFDKIIVAVGPGPASLQRDAEAVWFREVLSTRLVRGGTIEYWTRDGKLIAYPGIAGRAVAEPIAKALDLEIYHRTLPRDIEADVRRAEAGFLEPDYDDGDDLRARRGLALAIGLTAVLILAGLVIYSVL